MGQLGGMGGFTGTLQTGHQDDRGVGLQVQLGMLHPHQLHHLVMDNFHQKLAGRDGGHHLLADGLFLYIVRQLLGYLVTYIGLQQCLPDLLDGFGDIDFSDMPLPLQHLEGAIQFGCK